MEESVQAVPKELLPIEEGYDLSDPVILNPPDEVVDLQSMARKVDPTTGYPPGEIPPEKVPGAVITEAPTPNPVPVEVTDVVGAAETDVQGEAETKARRTRAQREEG